MNSLLFFHLDKSLSLAYLQGNLLPCAKKVSDVKEDVTESDLLALTDVIK